MVIHTEQNPVILRIIWTGLTVTRYPCVEEEVDGNDMQALCA